MKLIYNMRNLLLLFFCATSAWSVDSQLCNSILEQYNALVNQEHYPTNEQWILAACENSCVESRSIILVNGSVTRIISGIIDNNMLDYWRRIFENEQMISVVRNWDGMSVMDLLYIDITSHCDWQWLLQNSRNNQDRRIVEEMLCIVHSHYENEKDIKDKLKCKFDMYSVNTVCSALVKFVQKIIAYLEQTKVITCYKTCTRSNNKCYYDAISHCAAQRESIISSLRDSKCNQHCE